MKPRIWKVAGRWWCGTKDNAWIAATKEEAYARWLHYYGTSNG